MTTTLSSSSLHSSTHSNDTAASTSPRIYISGTPNATDVLCQAGKAAMHHNVHYISLVNRTLPQYLQAADRNKKCISTSIVQDIVQAGGRFLKQDEGGWYILNDRQAVAKTSQALRDAKKTKRKADDDVVKSLMSIKKRAVQDMEMQSDNEENRPCEKQEQYLRPQHPLGEFVRIRPVSTDDAAAVTDLLQVEEMPSRHVAYCATLEDTVLAYCSGRPLDATTLQVQDMVVDPEHRRKGFGTFLMSEFIQVLRDMGKYHKLRCQVPESLLGFALQCGFQPDSIGAERPRVYGMVCELQTSVLIRGSRPLTPSRVRATIDMDLPETTAMVALKALQSVSRPHYQWRAVHDHELLNQSNHSLSRSSLHSISSNLSISSNHSRPYPPPRPPSAEVDILRQLQADFHDIRIQLQGPVDRILPVVQQAMGR